MSTCSLPPQYTITTDRSLMDVSAIHDWLTHHSYWAQGIAYETVKTAFDHSFVIGVLLNGKQVGYARLVTDYVIFAYLADVYILEAHRGQGLSKAMLARLFELDWVQKLKRIMLGTADAHLLYEQFGFTAPKQPHRWMEKSSHTVPMAHKADK